MLKKKPMYSTAAISFTVNASIISAQQVAEMRKYRFLLMKLFYFSFIRCNFSLKYYYFSFTHYYRENCPLCAQPLQGQSRVFINIGQEDLEHYLLNAPANMDAQAPTVPVVNNNPAAGQAGNNQQGAPIVIHQVQGDGQAANPNHDPNINNQEPADDQAPPENGSDDDSMDESTSDDDEDEDVLEEGFYIHMPNLQIWHVTNARNVRPPYRARRFQFAHDRMH